jgi:hypothetical protein
VKIFLGILSSSILSRRPSQLILCPFIHFTIFSPLLNSSGPQFILLGYITFDIHILWCVFCCMPYTSFWCCVFESLCTRYSCSATN